MQHKQIKFEIDHIKYEKKEKNFNLRMESETKIANLKSVEDGSFFSVPASKAVLTIFFFSYCKLPYFLMSLFEC